MTQAVVLMHHVSPSLTVGQLRRHLMSGRVTNHRPNRVVSVLSQTPLELQLTHPCRLRVFSRPTRLLLVLPKRPHHRLAVPPLVSLLPHLALILCNVPPTSQGGPR
jgi:hypothetical protein